MNELGTTVLGLGIMGQSLADNLKGSLGTKVEIKRQGKEGRIVVFFYSDDELDRLLDLLA